MFKRIFKQLLSNGVLVLEAQDYKTYSKRSKLSPEILNNYKNIQLKPEKFESYLLSDEVGFSESWCLADKNMLKTTGLAKGFHRPLQVFIKRWKPCAMFVNKETLFEFIWNMWLHNLLKCSPDSHSRVTSFFILAPDPTNSRSTSARENSWIFSVDQKKEIEIFISWNASLFYHLRRTIKRLKW